MIKPLKPDDSDFRDMLPPELQELDRELSAIRIEERPSFGPELEGELNRAWANRPFEGRGTGRPWVRTLMAAGLAGLMIAGVAVPSARARVADIVNAVIQAAASEAAAPSREAALPPVEAQEPALIPTPAASERPPTMAILPPEEDITERAETFTPSMNITFPSVKYMQEAESLIRSFYPLQLQRAGLGGSVKLLFWVNAEGVPENIQMREGSGYRSLNYAAMRAARELQFEPATRDGEPVGTWVEFMIHFVPGSGGGFMALEPAGSGGVGGN